MKKLLYIAVLGVLCLSCRSVQVQEQTNRIDSTHHYHYYDTLHITITDTLRVSVSSEMEGECTTAITFSDGGYYNAKTGEMQGIKAINLSEKTHQQAKQIADYQRTLEKDNKTIAALKTEIQRLSQEVEQKQNTADIQPKTSGWHRFLVGYFAITLLVAIALGVWRFIRTIYLH